jgi:hypothetical protein
MSDTKALDNVVERNKLSLGELGSRHDELWVEAHQAAAELKIITTDLADSSAQLILDECEIQQLRADLDVACHIKAGDKVAFDWAILTKINDLQVELDEAKKVITAARNELGVPQPGYPAPVANAAEILAAFLEAHKETK